MITTCAALAATVSKLTAAASIIVTGVCPAYVNINKGPLGMTIDFTASPLVRLDISNLSNVTLKGIVATNSQNAGINVTNSQNVLLVSPHIDHPGTTGIGIMTSNAVEVRNPLITRSLSDGVDIAGSSHIYVHDGACQSNEPAPGAHPDCIQMWSYNGIPSHDITVSGMTVYGPTEGIDNFGPNSPATYNVMVMNNTITTTFDNCITFDGAKQVVVTGNRCIVLPAPNTGRALIRVYCPTASNASAACPDAVLNTNASSLGAVPIKN